MRRRGLLLALAVVLAALTVPTGQAAAHADLIRAEPAIDAKLAQPPSQLTLFFSQGLKRDGSFIQLEDAKGTPIPVQVSFDDSDDKVMRGAVSSLSPGIYKVLWQTLSADDDDYHDGSYSITMLNPDGSAPAGAASADGGDGGGSGTIILVVVSIAVVVMVGGIAYYIRKTGRPTR